MERSVTLAMGAGGVQTNELIEGIFGKYFAGPYLTSDDAAVFDVKSGRMAFSTDGFIVTPWRFAGGNIGKLSVCGTVNDLACMGARPMYITASFIIEEGFSLDDLDEIARSMADTAKNAGVYIVAGDTKVVGKGQADGIFITTSGVGMLCDGVHTSGANARAGDKVIVSGDIGRHGCTILLARNDFGIDADVSSDCAPLWKNVEAVLSAAPDVHTIRDATRGGVGTVLYEIARQSGAGVMIDYEAVPVSSGVKGTCSLLGLEPLYLACEGRLVITAPPERADIIVNELKKLPDSENAAVIGEITAENAGRVAMKTAVGAIMLLSRPGGEMLPRIC